MKPLLLAALFVGVLWLPAYAAEPAATAAATTAVGPDTITFQQYRDWRVDFIARRQKEIAARLAAGGLGDSERQQLTREKSYYDRQAAMPPDQRDRLFRARFDAIDTNHDGIIERSERIAWHNKEAARYRRAAAAETAR